jgi:hypothetical protein
LSQEKTADIADTSSSEAFTADYGARNLGTALIEHKNVVQELAILLVQRYGERAASHAKHQSLKAARRDEPGQMEAWLWIANAVEQIWKLEPAQRSAEVPQLRAPSASERL